MDHNYRGASGGWTCYTAEVAAGNGAQPSRAEFMASLDNAPSIPEAKLYTEYF
jgi:hypothetical protein